MSGHRGVGPCRFLFAVVSFCVEKKDAFELTNAKADGVDRIFLFQLLERLHQALNRSKLDIIVMSARIAERHIDPKS